MLHKFRLWLIAILLLSVLRINATPIANDTPTIAPNDTLRISLITCDPGPDVYQIFGHTALRVQRGNDLDIVFNYGTFSFSDDFIIKFTKGETDYLLAAYDFRYFILDYVMRGSSVYEQELNLTHNEREAIFNALLVNARPENRAYRYNFLYNNCATRPRDIVAETLAHNGESVIYQESDSLSSFRNLIRHYGKNYSWLTFGIDMALGKDLDETASWEEHMFVPLILKKAYAEATIIDRESGAKRPMVSRTTELFHADSIPVGPPTPWYMTPMVCALALLLITVAITLYDVRHKRLSRWFDTLLGIIMCLAGMVIYFLICCSEHPATTINLHALWLTPLAIIPAILPYISKAIPVVRWYHRINLLLMLLFVILIVCGIQRIDIAIIPLLAVSAIRSCNSLHYYKSKLQQ